MVPNGDRPHAEPQEILSCSSLAILIVIGFIASHPDAAP
jgi:hypothetical protein